MYKIQFVSVVTCLSLCLIIGCLIFARGFLLNRKVVAEISKPCQYSQMTWRKENNETLEDYISWCDATPQYKKAILILVDAMKPDFVPRMKFLSSLVSEKGVRNSSSCCMFKFVADPPTTTMQRLKGIMTGTMPTFIDASANFNSYEIGEDSLIHQLHAAGKKIAFLGDDTWLSLFPRHLFHPKYVEAHPSFNAWDLDTVDRKVNETLRLLMSSSEVKSDWDILITHLLGVDHCGHRYGPNHPEMERKLNETDEIVQYVYNSMNPDTLLVVFGDHGMTSSGDHGGDSKAEVESALIFITKTLKRSKQSPSFNCPSKPSETLTTISQVDLVSTLSVFLGAPIPYSNIGKLIPNFMTKQIYTIALASNVAQVKNYVSKHFIPPSQRESPLSSKFSDVLSLFRYHKIDPKNSTLRDEFVLTSEEYLDQVKAVAVEAWTQFNTPLMYTGIFISLLSAVSSFMYFLYVPSLISDPNHSTNYTALCWLWPSLPHWSILCSWFLNSVSSTYILTLIISSASGLVVFFTLIIFKMFTIRDKIFLNLKTTKTSDIFALMVYLFSCASIMSNSYIIYEGFVLALSLLLVLAFHLAVEKPLGSPSTDMVKSSYSLQYSGWKNAIARKKFFKCSWAALFLLCILIRVSFNFFRCREELTDCKEEFLLHKSLESLPEHWEFQKYVRYGIGLLTLAVFVVSYRLWMMYNGALYIKSICCLIAKFIPSLTVVFLGVFWALHGLPFTKSKVTALRPVLNHIPLILQTITVFSLLCIWIKPLCITRERGNIFDRVKLPFMLAKRPKSLPGETNLKNGFISKPSNGMMAKETMVQDNDQGNLNQTILEESSDQFEQSFAYSIVTFCVILCLLLVQLTTEGLAPSIILTAYAEVCLVAIFRKDSVEDLSSWTSIISWTISSQYYFYATGHQAIFSAIPWDSAFLGLSEGNDLGGIQQSWYSWLKAGFAVVSNIYSSVFLFTFGLPLLVYWRSHNQRTIPKRKPSLIKAYVLCGKFLTLHGLKLVFCMICAAWHRRHLMVWKVFAPRLMFEGASFIAASCSVTISLVFLTHIDYLFIYLFV